MRLHTQQANAALKFAGYDFETTLIIDLFGSENHVGKRSAKKLRDALTHKVSESAVKELNDRQEELFNVMNTFVEKIRNFDNEVAA